MEYVENWHALAIAILHKAPLPPEYCFTLWEHGRLKRDGLAWGDDYASRLVKTLHAYGMTWSKVTQLTGYKHPATMVNHWEHRYGKIEI